MNKHLFFMLVAALVLGGCKKDNTDYTALSQDASLTQSLSGDVFKTVDNEAKNGNYSGTVGKTDGVAQPSAVYACATVTLSSLSTFPTTLTVDFGSGCTDNYGVTRSGKLIATFSGRYKDQGTVITVTTDDYHVNGHKVEGTKTITNTGRNSSNQIVFHVVDTDGKITKTDGGICTWTADYTETWVNGESSPLNICDDTYEASGYVQGVASSSDTYRYETTTPLRRTVCCYRIQAGDLDIFINGSKVASIDYGDGTCDAIATVTYGGKDYTIIMQ